MARKYADSPSGRNGGPIMRIGSPPSGSSILMTSAPRSASSMEPYGPASIRDRSSTRTPAKSVTASLPGPPGRERQLGEAHADGVMHGVGHCRRNWNDAGLAEPLGPERPLGIEALHEADA